MFVLRIFVWTWFLISTVFVAAVALGEDDEERGVQLFVAIFWPILLALVILLATLEAVGSIVLGVLRKPAPPKDNDPV